MIFAAKNEEGTPTWRLVFKGKKTVTRRMKPVSVGKILAIQPGRGKKQVCKMQVKSCIPHMLIMKALEAFPIRYREIWMKKEAHKEGFLTWEGLLSYFKGKHIDIDKTWRIEFKKIGE